MNENFILTPKMGQKPRINGARIFGVRPGSPILFKIPATGKKPLKYDVLNLPEGVNVDSTTGIITGTIQTKGEHKLVFGVSNDEGTETRNFRLIVGEKICLTPPMGWNSWYVHSLWVSQEKIEGIAKALVDTGLIDHGWTYINIDDCWQGERVSGKSLQPNAKFPDMKGMCDNIHSLGLKVGIYSTPWIGSYAGYRGGSVPNKNADYSEWIVNEKDRLEQFQLFGQPNNFRKRLRFFGEDMSHIDAKQFAEWGFDYLKYDWKPNDVEHVKLMRDAILNSGRDIVYSLSNSAPYNLAEKWVELANLWRTTGDIIDRWVRVARLGFSQNKWAKYAGPGHWNDPDMLQIGNTAHPHKPSDFFPTHLTPDEQYSQMSLWCLLCSPLLLSCDIASIDEFTFNLLTNDEVIEVNQDPLGEQARRIVNKSIPNFEVWAKNMEDGTKVVGLFNRSRRENNLYVKWSELGISGDYIVRDLWRQKNWGIYNGGFASKVPGHGVILLRFKKL